MKGNTDPGTVIFSLFEITIPEKDSVSVLYDLMVMHVCMPLCVCTCLSVCVCVLCSGARVVASCQSSNVVDERTRESVPLFP